MLIRYKIYCDLGSGRQLWDIVDNEVDLAKSIRNLQVNRAKNIAFQREYVKASEAIQLFEKALRSNRNNGR